MAAAVVELPSLLAGLLDGTAEVEVEGRTLREALDDLVRRQPTLGVHLFDESGSFRPHVLCFHNGTNTRWLDGLDVDLGEGDRIRILQAVSGG